MEEEIRELKQEMRERSMTAEPSPATTNLNDDVPPTPSTEEAIYEDETAGDFQMIDLPVPDTEDTLATTSEATTQTTLSSTDLSTLTEHIRTQTNHLLRARLDLEHLYPGETPLGLTPTNDNAEPILTALLSRLRALKAQLQTTNTTLHTLQTQETNLRTQFNTTLSTLATTRTTNDTLVADKTTALHRATAAESQVTELTSDLDATQRSIPKLHAALDKYRADIASLETLITTLESTHATAQALASAQISGLEARIATETQARREAETSAEERLVRMRGLEGGERELKGAVAEKQGVIRGLEGELEGAKRGWEREVGALNVRIAEMAAVVGGLRVEVGVERRRGVEGVERVRGVVERVLGEWRGEGEGEGFLERKGLLTPVCGGRFRDACGVVGGEGEGEKVEGVVVVGRGKVGRGRGRRGWIVGLAFWRRMRRRWRRWGMWWS